MVAPVLLTKQTMAKFKLTDDGRTLVRPDVQGDGATGARRQMTGVAAHGGRHANEFVRCNRPAFRGARRQGEISKSAPRCPNGIFGRRAVFRRYAAVGKGVATQMSASTMRRWHHRLLRLDEDVSWLYGLKDRPRYAVGLTRADILKNLASRRQWNACGDPCIRHWMRRLRPARRATTATTASSTSVPT